MSQQQIDLLDSLLDSSLEDLADAPTWQEFPPGVHRCIVEDVEQFKVEKSDEPKAGIKIKFKGIETVEAQDPAKVIEPNQVTTVSFFLIHPNENVMKSGQGGFKEIMAATAEQFGTGSNRELMEKLKGSEVLITTDLRKDKKTDREYLQLKGLAFV
jgi:hypothetical protein